MRSRAERENIPGLISARLQKLRKKREKIKISSFVLFIFNFQIFCLFISFNFRDFFPQNIPTYVHTFGTNWKIFLIEISLSTKLSMILHLNVLQLQLSANRLELN
jgi:hypothetical protein